MQMPNWPFWSRKVSRFTLIMPRMASNVRKGPRIKRFMPTALAVVAVVLAGRGRASVVVAAELIHRLRLLLLQLRQFLLVLLLDGLHLGLVGSQLLLQLLLGLFLGQGRAGAVVAVVPAVVAVGEGRGRHEQERAG